MMTIGNQCNQAKKRKKGKTRAEPTLQGAIPFKYEDGRVREARTQASKPSLEGQKGGKDRNLIAPVDVFLGH